MKTSLRNRGFQARQELLVPAQLFSAPLVGAGRVQSSQVLYAADTIGGGSGSLEVGIADVSLEVSVDIDNPLGAFDRLAVSTHRNSKVGRPNGRKTA